MIQKSKKPKILLASILSFCIVPVANADSPENFKQLVGVIVDYISQVTILLMAVALMVFFFGIARYILAKGDKESLEEGKRTIGYGIIALFVLASLWGILAFLGDTVGIDLRDGPTVQSTSVLS